MVFCDIMRWFKVLTTGLLWVEPAPEYKLYSEGCGWVEEEDSTRDQLAAVVVVVVGILLRRGLTNIPKTYSS